MAKVSFMRGATINLGNYQTTKVSVGIELDCTNEETGDKLNEAQGIVEEMYQLEIGKLLEKKNRRKGIKDSDQEEPIQKGENQDENE